VRLLIAELDGDAIGAHLIFRSGTEAYYLYSGTTAAGLKHDANYLLQWQAIQ
jgi:lipid II:glycine glycyltransferase (peptidoglycan interpeptide bridge formation enzyme)